jgi:hypothetical protein
LLPSDRITASAAAEVAFSTKTFIRKELSPINYLYNPNDAGILF